ncbi:MAG: error-prone DNA polymerase, partial [Candidatus Accumulibacter phosphatis]|nr:error-prone DNA polymerase [Candidatus Accumulibacter phosphatis]
MSDCLPAYAELHCCSNFSFLRGASHPEELVKHAQALGYSALAITDEASLAGVVRAHRAASAHGLPLLIGAEFHLADDAGAGLRLVLLAQNRAGYGRLSTLITLARRRSPKGQYRLYRGDLESAGDFAGSSSALPDCLALWIPGAGASVADGRWLAARFPARSWLAVELHAGPDDRTRLTMLLELATASGLPAVAAGDVHMHRRARRPLQDTLTAIRLKSTLFAAGHALFANGERHLR